jgi:hypothetical protein
MANPIAPLIQTGPPTYRGEGLDVRQLSSAMGSLLVQQQEPAYTHAAAEGRVFAFSTGVIANAAIPVADVPTTAAAWALYNTAASTSKRCLVPFLVTAYQASGTPAVNAALLGGVATVVQGSALTAASGSAVKATNGSAKAANAVLATGATLAGAPAWVSLGGNNQSATAGVGGPFGQLSPYGTFVVPAGFAFGMTILSGVGTSAKYGVCGFFMEVDLDRIVS